MEISIDPKENEQKEWTSEMKDEDLESYEQYLEANLEL